MIVFTLWHAYTILHGLVGGLAAYLLYRKGYVACERGVALAVVLFFSGIVGLLVAGLLHDVSEQSDSYPGAW